MRDRRRRWRAYGDLVLGSPGLVGYWRLGERSGTVARDETGANHGTYLAGATVGAAGLLAGDADAAVTSAVEGTRRVVGLTRTGFPGGASPRTIAIWLRTTAAGTQCLFMYGSAGAGLASDLFLSATLGRLSHHNGTGNLQLDAGSLNDGLIHHVAVTYDGALWTPCIDGVAKAAVAQTLNTASPGTFGVGTAGIGGDNGFVAANFVGTLDDAALWNRALTADEISQLYRAGRGN